MLPRGDKPKRVESVASIRCGDVDTTRQFQANFLRGEAEPARRWKAMESRVVLSIALSGRTSESAMPPRFSMNWIGLNQPTEKCWATCSACECKGTTVSTGCPPVREVIELLRANKTEPPQCQFLQVQSRARARARVRARARARREVERETERDRERGRQRRRQRGREGGREREREREREGGVGGGGRERERERERE